LHQLSRSAFFGYLQDHFGIGVLAAIVQLNPEEALVAATDILAGNWQAAFDYRAKLAPLRVVAVDELDLPGAR